MNDVALLVAALEGHGIRLYVRGALIDVRSDDRAVEREPIELLDELTKNKSAVLAFLQGRGEPTPPVRVTDKRDKPDGSVPPVSSSSSPVRDLYAPTACPYFPGLHAHDPVGGECLDEHLWQRVMPPGWRPPHLAGVPSAMPEDYRERQVRSQNALEADIRRLDAAVRGGR